VVAIKKMHIGSGVTVMPPIKELHVRRRVGVVEVLPIKETHIRRRVGVVAKKMECLGLQVRSRLWY
jgi:hypothetical protein